VRHRKRAKALPQLDWIVYGHDRAALPVIQLVLAQLQRRHRHGDLAVPLEALDICFRSSRNPPVWAKSGFVKALQRWRAHEVPTLDAAFGITRSGGKHSKSLREHEARRAYVVARVEQLRQRGRLLDRALFSIVEEEIGQKAGYAKKLYYDDASAALRNFLRKIRIS
jgi:hypothetical protein